MTLKFRQYFSLTKSAFFTWQSLLRCVHSQICFLPGLCFTKKRTSAWLSVLWAQLFCQFLSENTPYPTGPSLIVCGCVHELCFNTSWGNKYRLQHVRTPTNTASQYIQLIHRSPASPVRDTSPSPCSEQALQSAAPSLSMPLWYGWRACSSLDAFHI